MFVSEDQMMAKPCLKLWVTRSLAVGLMGAALSPAWAADREQAQIARLKAQLQQVQQSLSAAQEAAAKAEAGQRERDQAVQSNRRELDQLKASAGTSSRRAASLSSELTTLREAHAALTRDKAAVDQALAQQTAQAATLSAQLATERQQLASLGQQQAQCRTHNAALYNTGQELLRLYEQKGFAEVFSAKEPLLQTGRVTLENVGSLYADQLQAARLKP
jgi:chromosome segregation ATPase